jgi:enoyl-CoA hydratase/carnithine racemase
VTYKEILYDVVDHIATIILNRPERLNAWTRTMAEEVRSALFAAADDDKVRVIIITGAGRGFCAGADMAELENAPDDLSALKGNESAEQAVSILMGTKTEEQREDGHYKDARPDYKKRYSYLSAIPKPVIAAINGPAAGVGLIITLYCDLRFASEKARFSTAFSRRGLIAEHGISWMLPRIIGLSNALDLLYSARMVDAQEALRINLVNRVFPEEKLMESVRSYAGELVASVSPRSLRVMKQQVYEARFQTLAEATAMADAELMASMKSEDFKEGVAHFLEKRPPKFTGK